MDFPIVAPTGPDFHLCHDFYGSRIRLSDCKVAAGLLDALDQTVGYPVTVYQVEVSQPTAMPPTMAHGTCIIHIDIQSPSLDDFDLTITPNDVRGMAGWLLDRCGTGSSSIGGFVTKGFERPLSRILDPRMDFDQSWPQGSSFFTVTITDEAEETIDVARDVPGMFDPIFGAVIWEAVHRNFQQTFFPAQLGETNNHAHWREVLGRFAGYWQKMSRGGYVTWSGVDLESDINQLTAMNLEVDHATQDIENLQAQLAAMGIPLEDYELSPPNSEADGG